MHNVARRPLARVDLDVVPALACAPSRSACRAAIHATLCTPDAAVTSGISKPDTRIPTFPAICAVNVAIEPQTGRNPDVTGVSPSPYLAAVQTRCR
jgi:hypothetical protein